MLNKAYNLSHKTNKKDDTSLWKQAYFSKLMG